MYGFLYNYFMAKWIIFKKKGMSNEDCKNFYWTICYLIFFAVLCLIAALKSIEIVKKKWSRINDQKEKRKLNGSSQIREKNMMSSVKIKNQKKIKS